VDSGRAQESSYEVLRVGVFNRLVREERVSLLDAEHLLRAWETKAEEIGRRRESHDFWFEGYRWILGELRLRRRATQTG
jgi:hypothetical protein